MASIRTPAFVLALFISLLATGKACNIDQVRQSSRRGPMPGGWIGANVSHSTVVQLKQNAATNSATVTRALHVIEAYSQVVAGTNYCIRFSAAGNCSELYCKSFECVSGGHLPLTSRTLTKITVDCQHIETCNADQVRDNAQKSLPGGWHTRSSTDAGVQQLRDKASAIASVKKGAVSEAYSQVVAGTKYCIRFYSSGAADCAENCQPLTCVAGGLLPLPFNTNNPGLVTQIGVQCKAKIACDIEAARKSSKQALPGGWSTAGENDEKVSQLKQSAANAADISRALHVIEAYSQVVAGTKYCIRFSAAGNCSELYCQSFECIAGGHSPLTSQTLTNVTVVCQRIKTCNIDEVRELSQRSLLGGWRNRSANDDMVRQLRDRASAIASVNTGGVVEAYTQVVAGTNYCIRFNSSGSTDCTSSCQTNVSASDTDTFNTSAITNCSSNCQPLTCVAGGFLPLPFNTNNPRLVTKIGVDCNVGGAVSVVPLLLTIIAAASTAAVANILLC